MENYLFFENICCRSHPCRADNCTLNRNIMDGEKEVRFRYPSSNSSRGAHPKCFYLMIESDLDELGKLIKKE